MQTAFAVTAYDKQLCSQEFVTEKAKFLLKTHRKFLEKQFRAKLFFGIRFKWSHASQTAVLSLLPHADEPAVPTDGGGADHRDGGVTQPTQVSEELRDPK